MEKFPENTNNDKTWDWKDFYEQLASKEPSLFLIESIAKYCPDKGFALDIAAGNLRDTKYMLAQGFTVTAVDPSPTSAEYAKELNNPSLTMQQSIFGDYDVPQNYFSLVNAQDILFHFKPEWLNKAIERIKGSLKQGGVFCGDFLGKNDDWNYPGTNKTILDIEQIKTIFSDFDIKEIREVDRDETERAAKFKGKDKPKRWHFIHIIAVKK